MCREECISLWGVGQSHPNHKSSSEMGRGRMDTGKVTVHHSTGQGHSQGPSWVRRVPVNPTKPLKPGTGRVRHLMTAGVGCVWEPGSPLPGHWSLWSCLRAPPTARATYGQEAQHLPGRGPEGTPCSCTQASQGRMLTSMPPGPELCTGADLPGLQGQRVHTTGTQILPYLQQSFLCGHVCVQISLCAGTQSHHPTL